MLQTTEQRNCQNRTMRNVNITNHANILRNYKLSQCTIQKLKTIKEQLEDNAVYADPLWKIIINKVEETHESEEEKLDESEKHDSNSSSEILDSTHFPATQFYFTQCNNLNTEVKQASIQKLDIVECLCEELERPNGKFDFTQLESLTDEEFEEIVVELENKLCIQGIYNLCCSMNSMTLQQRIKYATTFYTCLLLPKIISLEKPSRLLLSGITECLQKFPDDVQKYIFIPLLNVDLKDTSIVNAIANAFESEKSILITDFLLHAKELKPWHLPILHNLISVKTDIATNDKFLQLLSKKALDFAQDKNYGKLVLLFTKTKGNFTEQQKNLLWEIANVNQTWFKKPIQNVLKLL